MFGIYSYKRSCLYSASIALLIMNFFIMSYIIFLFWSQFGHEYSKKIVEDVITFNSLVQVNRTFVIDYNNDQFLKDGIPFKYISGSLHYFRLPRAYWKDRLRKFRAAGLNAVSVYVEWSYHEEIPRKYDFTGEKDLEYFLQLAVEENLLVILRPGPYICAERDFGGLPPWLLTLYPVIQLRTDDENFKREVKLWFDVLLTKLSPYLYGNGGPIITVQVENEYGSYPSCNMDYKIWLRDLMYSYIKDKAVLFTTDGAADQFLKCGPIPNVFTTVDFGTSSVPNSSFSVLREYQKKGPLVNSEFYPGWLTVWEQPYQTISTSAILKTMEEMLAVNASFNFYMFFGGTNFGFTNGANINGIRYDPQLTSYDYDAPLNEAGDPTAKYYAIRNFLSKHVELPNIEIPKPAPKGNYGNVTAKPTLSVFNYTNIPDIVQKFSEKTATFEEMEVYHGYMLYETVIPQGVDDPAIFDIYDLRDRAIVFVNEVPTGILSRTRFIKSIPLMLKPKDKVSLLVENQGRVNYGPGLKDPKGIITNPTLNGQFLNSWVMVGLPLKNVCWVENFKPNFNVKPPAFYYGELILPPTLKTPLDTYLDMTGWGKGVVFINNFNIGRYWPNVGPQVTLYVPGVILKLAPNANKIVVFETEFVPKNFQIKFTDQPYLNKTPPIGERDSQYL